jgi:predicted transcriptional regulator
MRPRVQAVYDILVTSDTPPTIGQIARQLRLSRSVVHYALQELIEAGLVEKRDRWREGLYRAIEYAEEEGNG